MSSILRAAALGLLPCAVGQIYSFSPASQVTYSVTIPNTTAASNLGPVYFQIQAPTTYQWVALGEGSRMAGSNMFIIYASSADNITLSARLSTGHSEPTLNSGAEAYLLNGSGIISGYMIANVRCDSCLSWNGGSLDTTSSSSKWIWAVKKGTSLDSSERATYLDQHDAYGTHSVNTTQGTISSINSSNPFTGYNATAAAIRSGNVGSSASTAALIAHGVIMAIAFVVFFPIFAMTLPVLPYSKIVARVHAPLQVFTLVLAIAGLGLGVYLANQTGTLGSYHPILGFIIMAGLLFCQPLLGLLQHLHFRKTGGKSLFAYIHRWFGRMAMALGIINGGLGFLLSGNNGNGAGTGAIAAYAVVAAVIGVAYLLVLIFPSFKHKNRPEDGDKLNQNSPTETMELSNVETAHLTT